MFSTITTGKFWKFEVKALVAGPGVNYGPLKVTTGDTRNYHWKTDKSPKNTWNLPVERPVEKARASPTRDPGKIIYPGNYQWKDQKLPLET